MDNKGIVSDAQIVANVPGLDGTKAEDIRPTGDGYKASVDDKPIVTVSLNPLSVSVIRKHY